MTDAPASASEWPLVDFLLALRADQQEGRTRPLHEYLARYPGHEDEIAREYLLVKSLESDVHAAAMPTTFGAFALLEELGTGGEGTVYLAHDPLLGRSVALKVLRRRSSDLDEARVLRAASIAARLDHPHLARIHGAGRHGNQLWVAMQYVDGTSLADELDRRRASGVPFDDREVATMLGPIARALQHAHDRGVVHRDVKPGNLLLRRSGALMLTDFGLARGGDDRECMTATGELRGTPCYMAPERLRHGTETPSIDVFALGVVAYECATLRAPFRCISHAATIARVLGAEIWTMPDWSRLGGELRAVLAMATAKDPRRRYVDAAAFARDLDRLAAGQPVLARSPGPLCKLIAWSRRERLLATSLAVTAVALLAGFASALGFLRREHHLRETATAHAAQTRAVVDSILFEDGRAYDGDLPSVTMRERLVHQAVRALTALAADDPSDQRLQRELCLAWLRLADVCGDDAEPNLGDRDRARECCAAAERIARTQLEADPRQPALLAAVQLHRGDLVGDDFAAAAPHYREVLATLGPGADGSDDRERRALRGAAMGRLGLIARDAGDLAAARQWIERSQREFAADTDDPDTRQNLIASHTIMATILAAGGDTAAAEHLLRDELTGLDAIVDAQMQWRSARARAQLERVLANVLMMRGASTAAMEMFDRAIERGRDLWRRDPSDRGAAARLADLLLNRAHADESLGNDKDADTDRSEATAIAARLGIAMGSAAARASRLNRR